MAETNPRAALAVALDKTIAELKKAKAYSPAEVLGALTKTFAERLDFHKAQLAEIQKREAAGSAALSKGIGSLPDRTPSFEEMADGNPDKDAKKTRSVFDVLKAEDFIDLKNASVPGKRIKSNDAPGSKMPEKGEEISAEGSGGDIKKGKKLKKDAMAASMPKMPKSPALKAPKPPSVPGAGAAAPAPKAPAGPKGPGAAKPMAKAGNAGQVGGGDVVGAPDPMAKAGNAGQVGGGDIAGAPEPMAMAEEYPETIEDANGGKMTKDEIRATEKAKCPSCGSASKAYIGDSGRKLVTSCSSCKKGGKKATKKMEIPATTAKANGGQGMPGKSTKKMEIPATTEKANGGKVSKKELGALPSQEGNGGEIAKAAMSPVFQVHAKMQASKDAHTAHQAATAAPGKMPVAKMPTVQEHASRSSNFNDFMPAGKFGKAELDSAKCQKCKRGMTLCKCN